MKRVKRNIRDIPLRDLAFILFPLLIFILLWSTHEVSLHEDALITMRYVEHISKGYGYAWNPGDDPVFGSTSFLWTILLAMILTLLPLSLPTIITIIQLSLSFVLLILLYTSARWIMETPITYSVMTVIILSLSRLFVHAKMGFETIFFTVVWFTHFSFLLAALKNDKFPKVYSLKISIFIGFVLFLVRPEGVIIASTSILSLVLLRQDSWKPILWSAVKLYIFPSIAFLGFQFLYFGYPFPNTMYVKAGFFSSCFDSAYTLAKFLFRGWPIIIVSVILIWIALQEESSFVESITLLFPLGAYTIAYLFIDQTQNAAYRFQFPVLPILLLLFGKATHDLLGYKIDCLIEEIRQAGLQNIRKMRRNINSVIQLLWIAFMILGLLSSTYAVTELSTQPPSPDERVLIGKKLARFEPYTYRIALTEAGGIAYYSKWIVLDVIGLNDEYIAHNKFDENYLADFDPDLIQFHCDISKNGSNWSENPVWNRTVGILAEYAWDNNYSLIIITEPKNMEGFEWLFANPNSQVMPRIQNYLIDIDGIDYVYRASED